MPITAGVRSVAYVAPGSVASSGARGVGAGYSGETCQSPERTRHDRRTTGRVGVEGLRTMGAR